MRAFGLATCLQRTTSVRALLVLFALAIGATYVVVAQLPEGSAQAETWLAHRETVHPQQIESISIDGRGLPTAQLRAALTSHAGEQLDSTKLATDRAALQAALAARGYLAAEVEPAVVTYDAEGGAFLTFSVRQGALFHLRNVTVTGPAARTAGVVTLSPGDIAESARIGRARQGVADAIATHAKASVETKLHVDAAAALVDVELATR